MMPIGPLMIEHRLIERMIEQLNIENSKMKATREANPRFIEVAADFFRVYTDFCHHGKEEHILFGELSKKPLSAEHQTIMEDLIQEHIFARTIVKTLLSSKESYERGNMEALPHIERALEMLITFYPMHIEKEDKHFFLPSMEYFSQTERNHMLEAFNEFDRKLIHELYNEKVLQLEQDLRQKS